TAAEEVSARSNARDGCSDRGDCSGTGEPALRPRPDLPALAGTRPEDRAALRGGTAGAAAFADAHASWRHRDHSTVGAGRCALSAVSQTQQHADDDRSFSGGTGAHTASI